MKRWRCTHCDFLAWTDSAGKMENVVQTHLLTHYSSKLSKSDFRITWDCPYCATAKTDYDKTEAVSSCELPRARWPVASCFNDALCRHNTERRIVALVRTRRERSLRRR